MVLSNDDKSIKLISNDILKPDFNLFKKYKLGQRQILYTSDSEMSTLRCHHLLS